YRFRANGDPDRDFHAPDVTGAVWTTAIYALASQPDGKIIIGGDFKSVAGMSQSGICRLNGDGSVDSSFVATIAAQGSVTGVTLQPDGKIIGAGESTPFSRLNSDGSLDGTFANWLSGGVSIMDGTVPPAVAIQPDGRILLGGYTFSAANSGS